MGIRRLNHAVLYVRDVERSVAFYRDVLGFQLVTGFPGAAFLRAADSDNDHDLGLFQVGLDASGPQQGAVGLYHLAWSVQTLAELAEFKRVLVAAGSLVGASDHGVSKSLYAKDPDGVEFEVSWFVPRDRVTAEMEAQGAPRPLDIDTEIAKWGTELVGAL
ncbi:VOC family protein [Actinokineospora auranticolor]|uniref:Glyoxalase/bleomycin resistance protein/dioxygenase superfamily protein n=1 Tax=Actinokineospora auranticolor TaxID=155976 RepID=A0A2S6GXD3_9PSEU|nr:VOC family protein [Actinokineospora auranticolor]PPK69830.1 glyoxalase/bleomycin resistance protein/dioxygenase superfamily protein [Actinokineospora auranticolor]